MSIDSGLTDEQKETLSIVKGNPGITPEGIYNHRANSLDKRTIALVIFRLNQLGNVYKQGNGYVSVDVSAEQLTALDKKVNEAAKAKIKTPGIGVSEPSNMPKPVAAAPAPIQPTTPAAPIATNRPLVSTPPLKIPEALVEDKVLPKGSMHRAGSLGTMAYFFYINRNIEEGFSLEELKVHLKDYIKEGIEKTLSNLSFRKVINRLGEHRSRDQRYVWGKMYIYPFSKVLPDDCSIAPKVTKAAITSDTSTAPVTDGEKANNTILHVISAGNITDSGITSLSTREVMLEMIDIRISALSIELDNLVKMKEKISGALIQ